jgi:RNA polymerase sigma-70 factor, ECF subfamily
VQIQSETIAADHLRLYEAARPRLFSLAYRMTGSWSDSEDILQDAYLKFARVPMEKIGSAAALLTTIVTRLCLDLLRSSRKKRETYIGPWLPEPVPDLYLAHEDAADKETVSMAFLTVLQKLSPVERAVFLLREVFDYDYTEIAKITQKGGDYCRQIFHRAKKSLRAEANRRPLPPEKEREMLAAFLTACNSPDMNDLLRLLKEDMLYMSDAGGKVPASKIPIRTARQTARFIFVVRKKVRANHFYLAYAGGSLVFVGYAGDTPSFVQYTDMRSGTVDKIYTVLNPDKLKAWANRVDLLRRGVLMPAAKFLSAAQKLKLTWHLWQQKLGFR